MSTIFQLAILSTSWTWFTIILLSIGGQITFLTSIYTYPFSSSQVYIYIKLNGYTHGWNSLTSHQPSGLIHQNQEKDLEHLSCHLTLFLYRSCCFWNTWLILLEFRCYWSVLLYLFDNLEVFKKRAANI